MFEILTPEKAYILGFFATDGNLHQTTLRWEIQYRDKDIIYKIAKIFEEEGYKPHISYPVKKDRKYIRLSISSKKLTEELISIGLTPNKSYTIKFFNWIPQELLKDYIRGIFDGDGSLFEKNNALAINLISASKDFIEGFNNNLSILGISPKTIREKNQKGKSTHYCIDLWTNDTKKFLATIYYDNCIHLARKYETYSSFAPKTNPFRWSKTDIQYLIDNYETKTAQEIAYTLNRSLKGVQMRATHLGLRKTLGA